MSYDLMVFDPKAPPPSREGFLEWYKQQTGWSEGHTYTNPDVTTPELQAWYSEMIKSYPPMSGPDAADDSDNPKVTDYSIGKSVIYAAFAWSQAESARDAMFCLAEKYRIGFFDASADDGGVWLPTSPGRFVCVHGNVAESSEKTPFWKWWNKY